MHTGTVDSHRQMPFENLLPFENLRTDITIANKDSVPGGAFDAGPYFGRRTLHRGIQVTNNSNIGMEISDVGVSAKRCNRLGSLTVQREGSGHDRDT
jgi:hypothetical protein